MEPDVRTDAAAEREELRGAVGCAAWGILLLYVSIHLGRLDLLPAWAGYLLILDALPALSREESSAALLRPLGKLLCAFSALTWTAELAGAALNLYALTTLSGVVFLYFHFQLLTDLAAAASRYGCPEARRLLRLRTVLTLFRTLFLLPVPWEDLKVPAVALAAANWVLALRCCITLFCLRDSLAETGRENPIS